MYTYIFLYMCTYTHILHIYTHMFYMYSGALRYELPEIRKVFQDLIGSSLCIYVQFGFNAKGRNDKLWFNSFLLLASYII